MRTQTLVVGDIMQRTKALIENYYEAFNRQDTSALLELLHDEIVHDINQGSKETGKKDFAAFLERMHRCYKETVKDLIVMVNKNGAHASAEFMIDGTYIATDQGLPPASNQHYELLCGAFFAIKHGKISRVTMYYNLNDWIKQIKPPETATKFKILHLKGNEILPYVSSLANLRMQVFREYPYLYDSTLDYETNYLQTYVTSPECVMVLVLDNQQVVGASTGLPMQFEKAEFQKPFIDKNFNIQDIFYLGESVLLPTYRRQGIYHHFFYEREAAAKKFGAKMTVFCAVDRSLDDPLDPRRPKDYAPLDSYWERLGYVKHPELCAYIERKEVGEKTASLKSRVFWLKTL